MREISFRAKRQDNKQWVEGSLLFYSGVNRAFISLGEFRGNEFIEVSKDTVGQYTGLIDKNGIKIFEGDIVKVHLEIPYSPSQPKTINAVGVVKFNTEKSSYFIVSTSGKVYALCFIDEVIGNIHDNPELLKDGASDE